MRKYAFAALMLFLCGFLSEVPAQTSGAWTKIKDSRGIKLYERSVPGTDLMEYMGVTVIDEKMEVIGEALRDIPKYTEWLADCESARVEKKYDRNTFVLYLVLDPPVIKKRDVVLRNSAVYDYDNGNARINFFATDEVTVPVEQKNVRVTNMKGLFKMEYLGRNKTKFIYQLLSDPSGGIPRKVAYVSMKNYPFDSLRDLKKIVKDSKYSKIAAGTEEEIQINERSASEKDIRRIFGNTLLTVVMQKKIMEDIMDGNLEGIKKIAASGGDYAVIEQIARDNYKKYIDRTVPDPQKAETLKKNKKLITEITDLITTHSEGSRETIDSIVARYSR
ncbi:MAG: START domain-containing protein [Smithella sp.]|nr:START domain-containing protein [Smithella sp.]